MIEEISEEPSYLKVVYNKDSYQSIKLNNLRFDFDFILSLLSNAGGVEKWDRWAIIMVILTIVGQLSKCNIELSPDMGKLLHFFMKMVIRASWEKVLQKMNSGKKCRENVLQKMVSFRTQHNCMTVLIS